MGKEHTHFWVKFTSFGSQHGTGVDFVKLLNNVRMFGRRVCKANTINTETASSQGSMAILVKKGIGRRDRTSKIREPQREAEVEH